MSWENASAGKQFLLVVVVVGVIVAILAWAFYQEKRASAFDPGNATQERCEEDCGDRRHLYKPSRGLEHPECWCKAGDGFYELMW